MMCMCSCATTSTGPKDSLVQDALSIGMAQIESTNYPGLIFLFRPTNNAVNSGYADETLTVFIEGDGAPWENNGFSPPADPTPQKPIGLELTIQETKIQIQTNVQSTRTPGRVIAYLSRPCQFVKRRPCRPDLWTDGRYGDRAMQLITEALVSLMQTTNTRRLYIVGYSGGGVVAKLLEKHLDGLECIVTLAAPLDLGAWTSRLRISPLQITKSQASTQKSTPEVISSHYIGDHDKLVRLSDLGGYAVPSPHNSVISLPGVSHNQGWLQHWSNIRSSSCLTTREIKFKRGPHDNHK